MELDAQSKALRDHKSHLASLPNSISTGMAKPTLATSVIASDDLGKSSQSHKSNEGKCKKPTEPPAMKLNTGRWSTDEHKRFLAGLEQFGTGNWKKITDMVGTRSCTQIRTHAQKYFIALQKPHNNAENGGYARKKSKMLVGADQHIAANIKNESSIIITGHVTSRIGITGRPTYSVDQKKSGLTGMEVLAQAAINGENENAYESSLDKVVAELREKMNAEADAAVMAKNATAAMKPMEASSSMDVEKELRSTISNKRKLSDARAAAVISSYHEHKNLKESDYAAAVQETVDRKKVLDKLQAVAERQELLRLRQEVKNLNQTIIQLQQQSIESDSRVMEAITDRQVTVAECKNLREINTQLKTKLRRMVLLFEQSDGTQKSSLLLAAATQGANVQLVQARLTESELRYHTVTESLSRQTGVLTDQHRAILELNNQLEKERAHRHRVEYELNELRRAKGT